MASRISGALPLYLYVPTTPPIAIQTWLAESPALYVTDDVAGKRCLIRPEFEERV